MEILKLSNVSLTYHSIKSETVALKDISFTVKDGEFVGIIGPSGCGKTTLLAILSKIMPPSSGEIRIKGLPLEQTSNKTALMPQRDQLFEWRSVERNVTLGLELQRKKNKNTVAEALNLLKKYGLYDFRKKKPSELSGGMRQRAALIRTLVTKPDILLLDEPFSALDYQTRIKVADDVYSIIKQEKKTVLLVTHDLAEAISLCDKIIVLTKRPGRIKTIIDIDIDKSKSPLKRRESNGFACYFDKLWNELED